MPKSSHDVVTKISKVSYPHLPSLYRLPQVVGHLRCHACQVHLHTVRAQKRLLALCAVVAQEEYSMRLKKCVLGIQSLWQTCQGSHLRGLCSSPITQQAADDLTSYTRSGSEPLANLG